MPSKKRMMSAFLFFFRAFIPASSQGGEAEGQGNRQTFFLIGFSAWTVFMAPFACGRLLSQPSGESKWPNTKQKTTKHDPPGEIRGKSSFKKKRNWFQAGFLGCFGSHEFKKGGWKDSLLPARFAVSRSPQKPPCLKLITGRGPPRVKNRFNEFQLYVFTPECGLVGWSRYIKSRLDFHLKTLLHRHVEHFQNIHLQVKMEHDCQPSTHNKQQSASKTLYVKPWVMNGKRYTKILS